MHINVNFCINFVRTHNTVSHTMIAQSSELVTLKRDELVCSTMSSIVYASFISCILYVYIRMFCVVFVIAA